MFVFFVNYVQNTLYVTTGDREGTRVNTFQPMLFAASAGDEHLPWNRMYKSVWISYVGKGEFVDKLKVSLYCY